MKCPKCKKEMEVVRKDKSYNDRPKKEYERTLYKCRKCDAWVRVEMPTSK